MFINAYLSVNPKSEGFNAHFSYYLPVRGVANGW